MSITVAFTIAIAFLLLVYYYSKSKSRHVYLIDFSCYLPPPDLRATISNFIEHFEVYRPHERESIDFQTKMLERSGIGNEACVPVSLHQLLPDKSLESARRETEAVLFTVVEDLLEKHKIKPEKIDILVTNCSIYCPTPSMAAMIINKFGFRSDINGISLSGMGCSASLIAVNLARDLLRAKKSESLALVLSMEAVTTSGYEGRTKSMLLANTLFRMGGVGILLSNRREDERRAKYKLRHLLRTHMGSDDKSYNAILQQDDEAGFRGVSLSRSLLHVAANALKTNITELGPRCLPVSEQIRYGWSVFLNKLWKSNEVYVPNFKKAFQHFCIHAGGRAVIDAVEEKLRLTREDAEASRMTLYRFGNTSSSSIWYELCYHEAKGRMKKGDRVWQIAFGSGFKCNSAVWECISEIDANEKSAWSKDIHLYPVQIPEVADH